MTPTDPRHGTIAGFVAHGRAAVPACRPCLDAKMRYEKARQLHGPRKVSSRGTQRRIQALRALGYSLSEIATTGGWKVYGSLSYALRNETITGTTAHRVAQVYEQLCMRPATGPKANRIRLLAAREGWLPPLAWDDIDRDTRPVAGAVRRHDPRPLYLIDPVVVDRALAGDHVPSNIAERREIVARARAAGWPLDLITARTGITKPERYLPTVAEQVA